MTWREDLQEASLDGVPFYYENVGTMFGRKRAVTDIPNSDNNYNQDFGLKPKVFQVRAYVIGDNYHVARNNLIEVLEDPAPKDFIHPYLGGFFVSLTNDPCKITEDPKMGGIAMFDFTLIVDGPTFPNVVSPSDLAVLDQDKLLAAALVSETSFDLSQAISDVYNAVINGALEISFLLRRTMGKVSSIIDKPSKIDAAIDIFESQIGDVLNYPENIIDQINNLVSSVHNLINDFDFTSNQEEQIKEIIMLDTESALVYELESSATVTPTSQNQIELAANGYLLHAFKIAKLSAFCTNIVNFQIASSNEALALVQWVNSYFDLLLASEFTTPVLFESMMNQRTSIVNYLVYIAKSTPSVSYYTPPATTLALVLAYELFGDSTRDQEIIDENDIADPSLIVGGQEIRYIQ